MEFLSRYGKSAREVVPDLKKLVRDLEKKEEGAEPSDNRKILIKAIADIEASKDEPKIIPLKDFLARATASGGGSNHTRIITP